MHVLGYDAESGHRQTGRQSLCVDAFNGPCSLYAIMKRGVRSCAANPLFLVALVHVHLLCVCAYIGIRRSHLHTYKIWLMVTFRG